MRVGAVLGRRGLMLGFAAALIMVLVEGGLAYRTNRRLVASADWQERAFGVSTAVGELLASVNAAQSHERGFLITGQESALEPYRQYMAIAWRRVAALESLQLEDARQRERVAELRRLLAEHQSGLEHTIELRRQQNLDQVSALVASGQLIRRKAIEAVAQTVESAELTRFEARQADLRGHAARATRLALIGSVGSVVILVLVFVMLMRGLRRQQRLRQELQKQTNLLQSILNSQAEGLVVADLQGRFVQFNAAAERILGVKRDGPDAVEMRNANFVFQADGETPLPPAEFPIVRAMSGESIDDQDLVMRPPWSPQPLQLSVSARPLLDADGQIAGGVAVLRDVTERNRTAQALRLAKESAERANALKGQFVANMSHELRTPLNGVVGMLELLTETALDDEQRGFLKTARQAADALMANVNQVLDFSKLEASKLQIESITFSPRQCIEDTLSAHALGAHRKSLELTSELGASVPDRASGDPHRLRQVMENLISNAIKFTARGEVVVRAEAETDASGDLRLHVSVSDTGIGISEEKQRSIFEPFHQEDGSTTRRFGGTGLGLTIANELVRLMGGRLWIESALGRGSSFHFTVLLGGAASAADAAPEAESPRLDGLDWKGKRVLLVDDNETSRRAVRAMLDSWGFRVTDVPDGEAALAVLRQSQADGRSFGLYVVDLEMPGMDGLELSRRIAALTEGTTPLLVLSSSTAAGEQVRCREAGARGCVVKPVRQSDLLSAVVSALPGSGVVASAAPLPRAAPAQTRPRSPGARSQTPVQVPLGGRALDVLLVEDNEFNQAVAMQTLRRWGHQVSLARTGREAVDMTAGHRYDVVLMDVQMPEMDGLEATRLIRSREREGTGAAGRVARLPILAMTARAMEGDEAACRAAGMDGYLAKPLRLASLAAELERLLSPVRSAPPADPASDPASDPVRDPPLDHQALLEEAGGDGELLVRMVGIFRQEAPTVEERLVGAVDRGDAREIEQAAHALKSMIGHWRRGRAFQAAARLEALGRATDVAGSRAVYDELHTELMTLDRELDGLLRFTERERVMA